MNPVKTIYIIVFSSFTICMSAQNTNVMITYSQSKFIYSPGLEVNYFFRPKLGLNFGLNSYIMNYDPNQVVNITDNYFFNLYNINIGVCGILLENDKFKIGYSLGGKLYYGPIFKPLHYFENGGYYIFYDSSEFMPDFGIDMGILYYIKKYITGIKYDTARGKIRIVAGLSF